jgi:hypothetical protein
MTATPERAHMGASLQTRRPRPGEVKVFAEPSCCETPEMLVADAEQSSRNRGTTDRGGRFTPLSSGQEATGDATARSQMDQSVEMAGGPLQLVHLDSHSARGRLTRS